MTGVACISHLGMSVTKGEFSEYAQLIFVTSAQKLEAKNLNRWIYNHHITDPFLSMSSNKMLDFMHSVYS